ncbi:MAG TPA: BT1926 family outer membrane beta-barrel protein [Fulvivirga sp.]|nr:BT1926 family outer membrane beta-barrel protein [Fulvivirga sp.]
MKITILVLLFFAPLFVWSQDNDVTVNKETVSDYKANGGEKTLELQFEPFGNNPIGLNGIRARWFSTSSSAFRLNLFLGINTDSQITQQEDTDNNLKELRDKFFTFSINVRPGFEKHLKGTERLSPYFGVEGDLAYQTSSSRSENQNGTDVNYFKTINDNGFFRIGANAIAGLDYYITKKLYLGTEFGFGLSFTKLLAIKVKSDATGFTEPEPAKRGSSFDLGPNVNAQIRLGYAF